MPPKPLIDLSEAAWYEYAENAYEAYGETTDHKNFQGNPMPDWADLPAAIQRAWVNSVKQTAVDFAIRPTEEPPLPLDVRERLQIEHAHNYAHLFKDAGIPGHGQFMLIAKLAKALGL